MKKRSEVMAGPPQDQKRTWNEAYSDVRTEWLRHHTLERWNDIPQERERIRTIVRRMNRRFKRMSGQGFENA